MFGDSAALFPSWETLPHERLSPGVDTVGARLMVLRRLAHPDDERLGPPLRVVVTTVRSLVQPMAPDVADIEPVTLTLGEEADFDGVIHRLVELAYTRVDMVGKRGEFAVRGGILDVFPPTAEHPVRIEFWGDEISEMRMFSVADQRSIPDIDVETVIAVPCRELLLTDDVRLRAFELAADHPRTGNDVPGSVPDMLAKLGEGIPVDGMEALLPLLRPDRAVPAQRPSARADAAADLRPREDPHQGRRPDQDGPRVPRSVLVGGGGGRRRAHRPRGSSAHRATWTSTTSPRRAARRRAPVVDAQPAERRGRRSSWTSARRRRPADSSPASTRFSRCCGRTSPPADRRPS